MEPADVTSELSTDPLIGALVADRYRVERRLGQGGMGTVYVAEHRGIGKRVALKCLNPEYAQNRMVVERFLREARVATAAGNEHIVDVTDLGTLPDGAPFLVMELLEGRELGEALAEDGPFAIGRAVRILRQACDALAAAHAKGIVHRDLKPDNLFLARRTREPEFVKVLDFGIARLTEHESVQKLTGTGMALGTPHYMSPEQAQGLPSVDHRTDVYALGVILYELLVGELPFDAETFPMLVVSIVTRDAPSVRRRRPDVPPELEALIHRCLAKEAALRPQSVEELGIALAPFEGIDDAPTLTSETDALRETRVGRAAAIAPTLARADVEAAGSDPAASADPAMSLATGPLATPGASVAAPSVAAPSVAEVSAPRPSRAPFVVLALGLALAVAGAAVWIVRAPADGTPEAAEGPTAATPEIVAQRPEAEVAAVADPSTASVPVREPTAVAAAAELRLRVLAAPADARVFLDDVEYPNPLDVRRPRPDVPIRVRIAREGYRDHEELVVLDRDVELLRSLEPAPASSRSGMRAVSDRGNGAAEVAPRDVTPSAMEATRMDTFRDDF